MLAVLSLTFLISFAFVWCELALISQIEGLTEIRLEFFVNLITLNNTNQIDSDYQQSNKD